MKSSRQVALVVTLVVCGVFAHHSAVNAQIRKQTHFVNLAAIKDKRKVCVLASDPSMQKRIAELLKANTQLEIVERPEDAEFFVSQSTTFDYQTDEPLELNRDLPRLPNPELPQSEQQQRFTRRTESYYKTRLIGLMKTELQVYFVKDDGSKAIVWSKSLSSKVSSRSTLQTRPSANPVPLDPPYYYHPKDTSLKLTRRFIKQLKAIHK